MQISKELKEIPFKKFKGVEQAHFSVTYTSKICNHQKIHIFDFVKNPSRHCYNPAEEQRNFRLFISKKEKTYTFFREGDTKLQKRKFNYLLNRIGANITYCYPEISEETEKAMKDLMGASASHNHFIPELSEYLDELDNIQKRKREAIHDEEVYKCDDAVPEEVKGFIRNEIIPSDRILLFKKGNIRGTCGACGRSVKANYFSGKFYQFRKAQCPECGRTVRCILQGSNHFEAEYLNNVAFFQKDKNGDLWIRYFHIVRDVDTDYENLDSFLSEVTRYLIRGTDIARWDRYGKISHYMCRVEEYEMSSWERKSFGLYDLQYVFYSGNVREAVTDTKLQYAELPDFLEEEKQYAIQYIYKFLKYPVVEFLQKRGYKNIMKDVLRGWGNDKTKNAIYWNRKSLKECFKIPLSYLSIMENSEWTLSNLHKANQLYSFKYSYEEIKTAVKGNYSISDIQEIAAFANIVKVYKYIKKQSVPIKDYKDYLSEIKELKFDLTDKQIIFPSDFQAAHLRTAKMVIYARNKIERKNFKKAVSRLKEKNWNKNDLLIRVAESENEMIYEGKILHHCVATYAPRVAKGETAIFFIRKYSEPDKPYFTLELKDKNVIQCRTTNNQSYEAVPEVKKFVEEWLKKIVNKKITKTKAIVTA